MKSGLAILVFVALAPAAFAALPAEALSGRAMGTSYSVKISDRPPELPLAELDALVAAELERIEQIFSLFRDNSEISRFNAAPAKTWIEASDDLVLVTSRALELAKKTDGAFDPTIRPLVRLWRIDQLATDWQPPSAADIAAARQKVGYCLIEVRPDSPALRKNAAAVELDLNALVEGWSIDRLRGLLQSRGIRHALIELGGEFRACGRRPDGQPWCVGVEDPRRPPALYATVALDNSALGTSGDYRQQLISGGKAYSHIIDPRTGSPIAHDVAAVSIVAPDAITADGWSTALLVLGPAAGRALAEREGLAASFVLRRPTAGAVRLTPAAAYRFVIIGEPAPTRLAPSTAQGNAAAEPRGLATVGFSFFAASAFFFGAMAVYRGYRKRRVRLARILFPWLKWDSEQRGPNELKR